MGILSPQIASKKLGPLCRQLATSHEAGIPILRSLEMASCTGGDKRVREVMQHMHHRVSSGESLGSAARSQRKYLPPFLIEVVEAGEQGGRLDVMLRDLADYYEDRSALERRVKSSMVYPAFQLSAAWFLGTFALRLIPHIGTGDFDLAAYFGDYLMFQCRAMLVFGLAVLAVIGLARAGLWDRIWGWVTTSVWPLSPVTRKLALVRFFRSMSLLIESGMNIKSCVLNAAAVTSNPYIREDLMQAAPLVAQGHSLVAAFAGCRSLTPYAREMLAVGEETGELEKSLMRVARLHQDEAQEAIKRALTVSGVVILLTVACLIGYIVITFYMQYLQKALEFAS